MALRAIIIDDEPLAHDVIKRYAAELKTLEITAMFTDALLALETINSEYPDIIFLDINMPRLTGLEFIRQLRVKPQIILTTAYAEYALEGYDLNVTDYLLKPFSFQRFLNAVQKCQNLTTKTGNTPAPDSIFIKSNKKTYQVKFEDMLFVEGLGDYINIHTDKTHYVTNVSMKQMEEQLPADRFIRIHKSTIVNLSKIISIEGNMVEIGNKKHTIGQNYRTEFFNKIEKRSL